MTSELGDAPVEAKYKETMTELARFLDAQLNPLAPYGVKETGFVLMVFPFGSTEGRCNYMSNAQRQDVIIMLKEQLARFEGAPDVKGTA